ncbi:unnamed protein product, partial [marine sediment metagenome]
AQLKTEIQSFSHRTDIAGQLDSFIEFAYGRLNAKLRIAGQETILAVTPVNGQIDLPADFLQSRSLTRAWAGGQGFYELTSIGKSEAGLYGPGSGLSAVYVEESGIITVYPASDAEHTLTYYARIPIPTTTDVFLTEYPDMVLDACLEQVCKWEADKQGRLDNRASWMGQADDANAEHKRRRLGSRARAARPSRASHAARAT